MCPTTSGSLPEQNDGTIWNMLPRGCPMNELMDPALAVMALSHYDAIQSGTRNTWTPNMVSSFRLYTLSGEVFAAFQL